MTPTLPTACVKYAQTKTFTSATIPKALLKDHSTKPSSWGLIVVHISSLVYTWIEQEPLTLGPDKLGVIVPDELQKVAAGGRLAPMLNFTMTRILTHISATMRMSSCDLSRPH